MYCALLIITHYINGARGWQQWSMMYVVTWRAAILLLSLLRFASAKQKAGRSRFMFNIAALTFLETNDKMLSKTLATSFISTSPSVLLPTMQTPS